MPGILVGVVLDGMREPVRLESLDDPCAEDVGRPARGGELRMRLGGALGLRGSLARGSASRRARFSLAG